MIVLANQQFTHLVSGLPFSTPLPPQARQLGEKDPGCSLLENQNISFRISVSRTGRAVTAAVALTSSQSQENWPSFLSLSLGQPFDILCQEGTYLN